MVDETEFDRLVRASLERRAGEADTTVAVGASAREAVSRRRTTRVAIGAAAAVIVAFAVTGLLVRDGDGMPPPADRGDDSLPAEWRTEYWRDLRVEVPADWGYGGAPVESGGLVSCYPEAMIGPDGARLEGEPTRGYVGRPIGLTDICVPYPDNRPEGPQAPYVWLGAEIGTGTVELDNGYVQETVEVNGSTLTVASDNAGLRQRVLASARANDLCVPERAAEPSVDSMLVEGMGAVESMTVCAYQRRDGERLELVYANTVGAALAERFVAATADAGGDPRKCKSSNEYVVLRVAGEDYYGGGPVTQDYVINVSCPALDLAGRSFEVTEDLVRPWAAGGVAATLYGPLVSGPDWIRDYFIGPQG